MTSAGSGRYWRPIRSFRSARTFRSRTWLPATTSSCAPGSAGLTKACGSAACAAAVAAVRLGLVGHTVTVTLPGGELRIEWRARDDHVLMTGPVAYEYEGKFDPALFDMSAAQ